MPEATQHKKATSGEALADARGTHPAWDRAQPLWFVTEYGPGLIGVQRGAYVHAPDVTTAAIHGAECLAGDNGEEDSEVTRVHVTPVAGRRAFDIGWEPRATPSALQCCGGGGHDDGHSGWCDER